MTVVSAPPGSGDLGHDRGDVVVAERFWPGQYEVGAGGALAGQGAEGDGGDVPGVDEAGPAASGGGQDASVFGDAEGVRVLSGEVLHEPRGPQHRPLPGQAGQGAVHRPRRRAALGMAEELRSTARCTPAARACRRKGTMTATGPGAE